jgi:hypothetical protein
MIGITLILIGEIFAQIGTSIGKYEVSQKKESFYAMGFLHSVWASIFLLLMVVFWQGEFRFTYASLPTFALRALLEVILVFVAIHAVLKADRSTFSFLRVLTLPFLLMVDVALGYSISVFQMVGISSVVIALIFLFLNHGLSRQGKLLSLLSALLAVGTISLYKYNITNFNSVEGEQVVMHFIILFVIIITAWIKGHENVFKTLASPLFIFQSLAAGLASVFISFAYLFASASVITTTKRSFELISSMVFGRAYFSEKHFAIKFIAFVLIVAGVGLMFL